MAYSTGNYGSKIPHQQFQKKKKKTKKTLDLKPFRAATTTKNDKKKKKRVPQKPVKIGNNKELLGDYEAVLTEERPSSDDETPSLPPSGFDGISSSSILESAELQYAPTTLVRPSEIEGEGEEDYPAVHNFGDAKSICCLESSKLWAIAGPIAFNIWCNYGINSFTNVFVGHIGNVELSAVAISLSVIANFSFGFLVIFHPFFLFFFWLNILN